MRSLVKQFMILVLGVFVSFGFAESKIRMLSREEKSELRNLILEKHKQVSNLFVRYRRFEHLQNGEETYVYGEWALSGEKRYRKLGYFVPVGQPPSKRYGITVWDGKSLKAYDSEINNGSIRAEYDPTNIEHPATHSDYTRQLGHPTRGTIAELFEKHALEDWEAYWITPGRKIVFRSNDLHGTKDATYMDTWTFDLERGALITKYETATQEDGESKPLLTMTITEAKQVKPDIWLATKSHVNYIHRRPDKTRVLDSDLVVDEIKVNEPEIEEMFHFEFPPGSQYYDFIIGSSMVAGASDKMLEQALEDQAKELIELSPQAEPSKQEGSDDFENAKALMQKKSTPTTQKNGAAPATVTDTGNAQKSVFRRLWWLFAAGGLILLLVLVTVLQRQFVGKRKEFSK